MVKLNPHLPLFRFAPYIMLGLVLTLSAVQVPAQVIAGSLKVRVVDANGIPVAGASVIITKENRGPRLERITSRDGIAFFNNLEPGSYSIDVVALGFAVTLAKAVPITIVEARSVTVRLETNVPGRIVVASINEEPPEQLSALPNLNNDLTPLLQVVPGAVAIGSAALGKVVIDGKGKDQQNARLDGVDATAMVDVP